MDILEELDKKQKKQKEQIRKALKRLEKGRLDENPHPIGVLMEALVETGTSPAIMECVEDLLGILLRNATAASSSTRTRSIREMRRHLDILRKLDSKSSLFALRQIAKHYKYYPLLTPNALTILEEKNDLKGFEYVAQWAECSKVRFKSIEIMYDRRCYKGLLNAAQFNMYQNAKELALHKLSELIDDLIRMKDIEALNFILKNIKKKTEIKTKAIQGLQLLFNKIVKDKNIESLLYIGMWGTKMKLRDEVLKELGDVKSLKSIISACIQKIGKDRIAQFQKMETEEKKEGKVTKVVDKIKQSIETTEKHAEEYKFLVKAAEKLGESLLEELKESKDITGLEYIATYAPRDKIHIWKSAINAIHDIELAGEPAVYGKVAAKTKKVLSVDSEK